MVIRVVFALEDLEKLMQALGKPSPRNGPAQARDSDVLQISRADARFDVFFASVQHPEAIILQQ